MQAKDFEQFLNHNAEQMKAAKKIIDSGTANLNVLEAKIRANKESVGSDQFEMIQKEMRKISELKNELNGIRSSK